MHIYVNGELLKLRVISIETRDGYDYLTTEQGRYKRDSLRDYTDPCGWIEVLEDTSWFC